MKEAFGSVRKNEEEGTNWLLQKAKFVKIQHVKKSISVDRFIGNLEPKLEHNHESKDKKHRHEKKVV